MSARSILAIALATSAVGCRPDAEPPPAGVAAADTLRVLAYNIHHGEGMDGELDLARIAALVREVDPDLVALQEVDSVTTRTAQVDQAAELGRLTGLQPVFGRFMPYQGGAYGMALLSRWPISSSANHRLPDGAEPRTALAVTVTSPATGRSLRFVGIHFYRTDAERLAQATTLERLLGDDTVPTILAGDFNSTPASEVMRHLSRGWDIVEKGPDRLTFPSYGPEREIDFVLVRPGHRFEVLGGRLLDEPVASDHRPVVVDLVVGPGDRVPEQDPALATVEVTLFFTDAEVAGTFDCAAVRPATRTVPPEEADPAGLLRLLFRGVTAEERAAGLSSHFDPGPGVQRPGTRPLADHFRGVVVEDGTAFVDFEADALAYLNAAACAQASVKSPIERTLLASPDIDEVRYRIDGVEFDDWDA